MDDLRRNREAEARPFPCRFRREKWLHRARGVFLRDPVTVVLDREHDIRDRCVFLDPTAGAPRGDLSRVPFSLQASHALRRRFTSTCVNNFGSHEINVADPVWDVFALRAHVRDFEADAPPSPARHERSPADPFARVTPASPRTRDRNPFTIFPIRSACSVIASAARSERASPSTLRASCSARPMITPSGVDTSWAMPVASAPSVARRSARIKRSSRLRRASATARSRANFNSVRCRRNAMVPNANTMKIVAPAANMSRVEARISRSRSRSAVATTTSAHVRCPSPRYAIPAIAIRIGSPRDSRFWSRQPARKKRARRAHVRNRGQIRHDQPGWPRERSIFRHQYTIDVGRVLDRREPLRAVRLERRCTSVATLRASAASDRAQSPRAQLCSPALHPNRPRARRSRSPTSSAQRSTASSYAPTPSVVAETRSLRSCGQRSRRQTTSKRRRPCAREQQSVFQS